jgi:CRISPR-associated protein Cmr6
MRITEAWRRVSTSTDTHPGYWLSRMIGWVRRRDAKGNASTIDWAQCEANKKGALEQACRAINAPGRQALARCALARRQAWLAPLERAGRARRLHLVARTEAILWLASPSPLEVGLALHHLYGFPVLPGTALKGLALRVACAQDAGEARARYGTTDHAGSVAMLDGLPVEPWSVGLDVMTPHFGEWYRSRRPPDDTESPVPVNFLVIGAGSTFEVALVGRGPGRPGHLDAATGDLERGLDELGLGAKTAAGYGVFAVQGRPPLEAAPPRGASGGAGPAPSRSHQASATAAQIDSLKRPEVRGRLRAVLDAIDRCAEGERAALRVALRGRLAALGISEKELRELAKLDTRLPGPA